MINTDPHDHHQPTQSPQQNFLKKDKEAYQGEEHHMSPLKGHSQLMLPVQVIDDVTLLRKQVKAFSKTVLILSRKYYDLQEKAIKTQLQLEEVQAEKQRILLENSQLSSQLEKIKKIEHTIHQEVSFREQLIEEQRQDEKSKIIVQREQKIEDLEAIIKSQQSQLKENKICIEQLKGNQKKMEVKIEQWRQAVRQKLMNAESMSTQNRVLKYTNSNLEYQVSTLSSEIGLLKLQIQQLDRQLKENKKTFKEPEQFQLVNLNRSSVEENKELSHLSQENNRLKGMNSSLASQCNQLKQRITNLVGSEKDIEHIVIDRFLEVMNCYKDKLHEGGSSINVKQNLNIKKEAFVKRMDRQYLKFLDKNAIK